MVHRINKYLLFQISGWVLFVFFNIYISFLTEEINVNIVIVNTLLGISGVLITHLYRNYILKKQWVVLTMEKLLLKVFISISLLSVVYLGFYYFFIYIFLYHNLQNLILGEIISSYISIFILLGFWNAFYFSWSYIEANRKQYVHQLQLESAVKDLEIKTIRANLQPHFIFNSLNSIRALIDEDPEQARNAVTKISTILRNNIANEKTIDTLENELKLTEDYLDLEKIRYEERLHIEKNIEPETLQVEIPTMMLQTLVENAIKHGISLLEKGGTIFIHTYLEENSLHIKISNTGCLQLAIKHEMSLGFGINSIKERLQYLYKKNASLTISEKNNLVIVHIKIPKK